MTEETQESVIHPMPLTVANDLRCFAAENVSLGGVQEQCGFLRIDEMGLWHIIEVENQTHHPGQFKVTVEQTAAVWREYGETIVGCWHTHPMASTYPSSQDKEYAPIGLRYFIVTIHGVWEYDMKPSPPKVLWSWRA